MSITADDLVGITDRLLEAGVPPTAIARAFELDPTVVRGRLTELNVQQYGAAELSEALAFLQWEAYEVARWMIHEAPYHLRSRFVMAVLNKSLSLTGRQSPETFGEMRQDLLDLMTQMGVSDDDLLAGTDTTAFVPAAQVDVDKDEAAPDSTAGSGE